MPQVAWWPPILWWQVRYQVGVAQSSHRRAVQGLIDATCTIVLACGSAAGAAPFETGAPDHVAAGFALVP